MQQAGGHACTLQRTSCSWLCCSCKHLHLFDRLICSTARVLCKEARQGGWSLESCRASQRLMCTEMDASSSKAHSPLTLALYASGSLINKAAASPFSGSVGLGYRSSCGRKVSNTLSRSAQEYITLVSAPKRDVMLSICFAES